MKYRIKNWSEYQHYKDRNPPWVKLHVLLLSSRDWVMWTDASRTLAIVCMVLAAQTGGEIDGSPDGLAYLKRAGYLNSKPTLNPLIDSGFLVQVGDASAVLADASASVSVSISSSLKSNGVLKKPSLDEIQTYCVERGNNVDPEKWRAYYESNGWRVGKNPMKDWKAAVRTWEKSEFNQASPKQSSGSMAGVIL